MSDIHPIDLQVGTNLRLLRKARGYSQGRLAAALGITFQQVQKYERGTNRISASMMWEAARFLEVSIEDLFKEPPVDAAPPVKRARAGASRTA